MDQYLSKCRACLKRNAKVSLSILKDGNTLRDVMSCLSIKISDADVMPQYICSICHRTIMRFQTFKQNCEKSEQFLRELIDFQEPIVSGEATRDKDSSVIEGEDIIPKCEEIEKINNKEENNRTTLGELYFSQDSVPSAPVKFPKKKRRLTKYLCASCGYAANDISTLRVHTRFHTGEKPYPCTQCDRRFAVKANLKSHMQLHTGSPRFVCEVCGRAFATGGSLQNHTHTHTGARPHVCRTCSRAFASASNLRAHTRTHSDEKPYSCDVCTRTFKSSSEFHHHKRRHTGARPYECEQCPRTFAAAYTLRAHTRTHAPVDLTCRHCNRTFASKASLAGHKRVHNSVKVEKRFECERCEKRFSRRTFLNKHRKTHKDPAININDQSLIVSDSNPNPSEDTHTVREAVGQPSISENSTQEIISNQNTRREKTKKNKLQQIESKNINSVVKTIRASNSLCQNRKQNENIKNILRKNVESEKIKPKTVCIQPLNQLNSSSNTIATPSVGSFPTTPLIRIVPMCNSNAVPFKILGTPIKMINLQNLRIQNSENNPLVQTSLSFIPILDTETRCIENLPRVLPVTNNSIESNKLGTELIPESS